MLRKKQFEKVMKVDNVGFDYCRKQVTQLHMMPTKQLNHGGQLLRKVSLHTLEITTLMEFARYVTKCYTKTSTHFWIIFWTQFC